MAKALGQYELLAKLATGGMGEIFIARLVGPAGFERLVVIKQMLPHLADHERAVAMFIEEANLAARIRHPNVCQVQELGVSEGKYFLVMEYLEGITLSRCSDRLRATDPILRARLLAGIGVQACEGLHHIHEARNHDGTLAGIVHRDISPQNLFVTTDGNVKILDFGIAKRRDSQLKTRTGALVGKLCYMAPEQVLGASIDARTDVFALGAVLFEQATGERLFHRGSDFLTLKAITEEPLPPSPTDPGIRDLATPLLRALARDPAQRYGSARELSATLGAALASSGGPSLPAEIATWVDRQLGEELQERRTLLRGLVADPTSAASLMLTATGSQPEEDSSLPSMVPIPIAERSALASWQTETVAPLPVVTPKAGRRNVHLLALAMVAASVVAAVVWSTSRESRRAPAAALAAQAQVATTKAAVSRDDISALPPIAPDLEHPAPIARESTTSTRRTSASPKRHASSPGARGYFTVVSVPYAEIYVDGERVDVTPLVNHPLAPGVHRVRAVRRDGRSQQFSLRIVAGQELRRRLTW